jgi:histidinol-phosphatase
MTTEGVAQDLELALALADAADAITMARFGALDLRVDQKPDLTPVTDADEAVVKVLRKSGKPVVLAANKVDDQRTEAEAYGL